jgi:sporulation protein YtfJ
MSEGKVEGLLSTTMGKIREMIDVNTVIGDPIRVSEELIIIPISKVSLGFGTGGSDLPSKTTKEPFAGGSGAGMVITPIAFLVAKQDEVKILQMSSADNTADRMVNLVPDVIDKIADLFKK